ncbi:MAG TPA: DNA methyltransferase, partial [Myxococcota bacterium]|nr:DNA methyltransferase [Myxococcota bacterium]
QMGLFGDAQVMHDEQERARAIKSRRRVTVVIGNPPYRRVDKKGSGRGGGGWVLDGSVPGRQDLDQSLFDDILDVAKQHTIFSHHASLYNLYVYFWRWAIWKAFEAHGPGPGVLAFITASSWLTGPGFVGLRKLVREVADEAWILDLGGDNKGAVTEKNVFAIQTPVAITILARFGEGNKTHPAQVHYRRIQGDRTSKLEVLKAIGESDRPLEGTWQDVPSGWLDRMMPVTGTTEWDAMPALADLIPWQQPGCKFNRLWPIAPDPKSLDERWKSFVLAPVEKDRVTQLTRGRNPGPSRETLFQTTATGRNIETSVSGLSRLADLRADAPSQPVVRYGYRSFDRQWAFDDPRMAKTDSPALWQSVSDRQLFLVSRTTEAIGPGPAMVTTDAVPDLHHFQGAEGGKDVLPLYRDRACLQPNVTAGLLPALGRLLELSHVPCPEDLAAYIYALLSTPAYQQRFASELETPGPRVPITRDSGLWNRAVVIGRRLLWLHTYAERFRDPNEARGTRVPKVEGLGWLAPVRRMPGTPQDVSYDPSLQQIMIGDGVVSGVKPEVWAFTVSGMQVVPKWLGYRTRSGAGKVVSSANPLDRIRPSEWLDQWNDELLDLLRVLTLTVEGFPEQQTLLEDICAGPLIAADELPAPDAAEREPPPTEKRFDPGALFG